MKILGIESSCDESSVSVVTKDKELLFDSVFSQDHSRYNGVYPEIAAREHLKMLPLLIKDALLVVKAKEISAIAVTSGPGLVGSLIVGTMIARGLAFALKKTIIPINHLEGHALSVRLTEDISFPFLLLLVSGGHSKLIVVNNVGQYKELGSTLDDAFGEAFDKVAKMLGLPYPGGKEVEQKARSGNETKFHFPRAMESSNDCNFSLSGIKTSVRNQIKKMKQITEQDISNISASFQKCLSDIIIKKLARAQKISGCVKIVAAGGVASNFYIRQKIEEFCHLKKLHAFFPPLKFCTDNAAMIAWAAIERVRLGLRPDKAYSRPKWDL